MIGKEERKERQSDKIKEVMKKLKLYKRAPYHIIQSNHFLAQVKKIVIPYK